MMGLPPPDVARVPWTVAYDQIKDLVAAKNDLAVEYELLLLESRQPASVTLPLVVHAPARRSRFTERERVYRDGMKGFIGMEYTDWHPLSVGDGGILCRREIVIDTLLPLARPAPFAVSLFRTIKTTYSYRVETGPCSVPGLPPVVAHSRRPRRGGTVASRSSWGACATPSVRMARRCS